MICQMISNFEIYYPIIILNLFIKLYQGKMFNFQSIMQNITSNKIVSNLTDNYKKLKDHITKKYEVVEVIPSIYHIDFPEVQHIAPLLQHINKNKYLLMNIGQYPYEIEFVKNLKQKNQNGKLKHIYYQYYSSIPFEHLIENMKEVYDFILENKDNRVYIICQENKIRSAVFLSCYIYVYKMMGIEDISEAILYVNRKLNLSLEEDKESSLYKNHHTLFKNIMHYTSNADFINKYKLQLLKISIKNAPKIKVEVKAKEAKRLVDLLEIKLAIEIRCGSDIILKNIYNEPILQGQSIFIDFQKLKKNINLSDEFLIIIKYIYDKKLFNVLRIQLNTNFIFNNFARVHQQDIDLSSYCQFDKKDVIFVDFHFRSKVSVSQLASRRDNRKEEEKKEVKKESNHVNLLQGEGGSNANDNEGVYFDWFSQSQELNENELNSKIESVMKTLNLKEQQRVNDKKQEEQDEDMDDYLKNLQSQA